MIELRSTSLWRSLLGAAMQRDRTSPRPTMHGAAIVRALPSSLVPAPKLVLALALALALGGRALASASSALASPAQTETMTRGADAARGSSDSRAPRAADQAAIDAYRRGDLDGARSAWLSVLEPARDATGDAPSREEARAQPSPSARDTLSRAERARVLYDLGNVAYRKKELLEAVGWYSAALRLSPRDGDIWWNLEHARSEAKLEPADRGDLSATLRRLVSALTLAESEWLVLCVVALWAAVLGAEALRGGRMWRRIALAGALVVLASLSPWIYNLARAARHPLLVIQDGKLPVKSEPRADAPAIAEVGAGSEVERLDALPDWTKIELENGVQGWVRQGALFDLDR